MRVIDLWVLSDKEERCEEEGGENDYPGSPENGNEFFQGDLCTRIQFWGVTFKFDSKGTIWMWFYCGDQLTGEPIAKGICSPENQVPKPVESSVTKRIYTSNSIQNDGLKNLQMLQVAWAA